jgi:hypothetical protein
MAAGLAVFTFAAWAMDMHELRELTRAIFRRQQKPAQS